MKFLLKVQNLVGFLMYLIFCGGEVETKAKIISSDQSLFFLFGAIIGKCAITFHISSYDIYCMIGK